MILDFLKRLFGSQTPTREQFAAMFMKELQRTMPEAQFEFDAAQFLVRGSNGHLINLANVYLDYCRADKVGRKQIMEEFLAGVVMPKEAPSQFEDARKDLLPAIRALYGLESMMIESGEYQSEQAIYGAWPMQPLGAELGVMIAYDTERAVQQLSAKTLEEWHVSYDEALSIAIDNLRAKAAPRFSEYASGFYVSGYNDYYDAARILLPELAWQLRLKGTPVAMIPNRSCLFVAGDKDEAALGLMLELADKVLTEQSRPLSSQLFRLDEKTWKPWCPPEPLATRLNNIQRNMLAADYSTQQESLTKDLERKKEDVFVATYKLIRMQGSEKIESIAIWTEGVLSWLPQTDLLALQKQDESEPLFVPWQTAMDACGHLFEKLPYILPRYRVNGFPSGEELKKIKATLNDQYVL
ncbi:DUF1444 family protein [Uliginosibacterium gangwonense]|uniref:DUF1444 family protein n=1 Tax=Uliginosibacterium gangwonense TaxID=392736 RepID=UPI00035C2581|nr:DUF1444 family protein [Uliginosibacterium gangwonense]